jgi:hypothetical protein
MEGSIMRKHLFVVAAAAAAALLSTAPAMAASSPVLTTGSVGGTPVAVNDALSASIGSGTKATVETTSGGSTGITCTVAAFNATAKTNPTAPGTATESVTALSISTCTSNITGVTKVNSVSLQNEPYSATVTDNNPNNGLATVTITGTSSAPIQSTVSLQTVLGAVSCVYQANNDSLTGTASNAATTADQEIANSITLTNQQFNLTSGPGVCPKNGFLSVVVGPVKDTTQSGSPTVFVN